MSAYYHSYLQTAASILKGYSCGLPFAVYLKNFFKRDKKYGSRDRKRIADLCYSYLRLGRSSLQYTLEDQVIIGYFLTHSSDEGFLVLLKPELVPFVQEALPLKLERLKHFFPLFDAEKIFDFGAALSDGVDGKELFLRIRPGKLNQVLKVVETSGLGYDQLQDDTLKITAGSKIDGMLEIDRDCVVQDISSQHCGNMLDLIPQPDTIWDACAGSGGKSIMLHDRFPSSRLYVSDIRDDILVELTRRLQLAQLKPQGVFCVDLTNSLSSQVAYSHLPDGVVDLVVADVPCTGSGTWRRSPEWLRCFQDDELEEYSSRQLSIVLNLSKHVKPGGYFLYITCSVFREENEDLVEQILLKTPFKLIKQQLFSGVSLGGDTLFAALFTL